MKQNNMPMISVVLPVYNAEKYLLEALKSISSQTFKDFEIIAINDGSTDKSLEILQNYAKQEPRMKIISRENKKLIATLNEGIMNSSGKYIARMDSDDIAYPDRFEKQVKYLEENNLDICGTWIKCFGDSNKIFSCPSDKVIDLYALFNCPMYHPSVMGKTEILKKYKYNSEDLHGEDYCLWIRLILDGYLIGNVPQILLNYRVSSEQICFKNSKEQKNTVLKAKLKYKTLSQKYSKYNIPELAFSLDQTRIHELDSTVNCLNNFIEKQTDLEAKHIIKKQLYKVLLNSSASKFDNFLRNIRYCRYNLSFFQKVILILASLFKLSLLKKKIQDNRYITQIICRLLKY